MKAGICRPLGAGAVAAVLATSLIVGLWSAPTQAARGEVKWAALYYEWQTGKFGWARPFKTSRDARKAAYNDALRRGIDPKRYRNRWWVTRRGCIYVYKAEHSKRWAWSRHANERVAQRTALRRCERGGRQCRKRVSVCAEE